MNDYKDMIFYNKSSVSSLNKLILQENKINNGHK